MLLPGEAWRPLSSWVWCHFSAAGYQRWWPQVNREVCVCVAEQGSTSSGDPSQFSTTHRSETKRTRQMNRTDIKTGEGGPRGGRQFKVRISPHSFYLESGGIANLGQLSSLQCCFSRGRGYKRLYSIKTLRGERCDLNNQIVLNCQMCAKALQNSRSDAAE